jgi:hypothetical protein
MRVPYEDRKGFSHYPVNLLKILAIQAFAWVARERERERERKASGMVER